jgi:hypothetical protein
METIKTLVGQAISIFISPQPLLIKAIAVEVAVITIIASHHIQDLETIHQQVDLPKYDSFKTTSVSPHLHNGE